MAYQKSNKKLVIVCSLAIASTMLIEATLFSTSDVYISSKPIMLSSNGTMTDYQNSVLVAKDFKSGIVPFDNLTQPSASGLEGVLYDRGYSCQLNVSSSLLSDSAQNNIVQLSKLITDSRRIALVQKGGGCNFYQKVYYSELDGAVGVVIYDNIPFREDDNSGSMKISKGNLTIPMYYVDQSIGQELYNMLQLTTSQPVDNMADSSLTTSISPLSVILLTMHPAVGGFTSAWEFTLIIVAALLAISFLASVGIHWHLWRIRRTQRTFSDENGSLSMNQHHSDQTIIQQQQQAERKVIELSQLDKFPTRMVALQQPDATKSPTNSNNSVLISEQLLPKKRDTIEKEAQLSIEESEYAVIPMSCVICLDDFAAGDTVRQLPCHHEYHCECIDPWLTIKSASCPLCKYDCTLFVPDSTVKNDSTAAVDIHAVSTSASTITEPTLSRTPSPFSAFSLPFHRSPSPRPSRTATTPRPSLPPPTYFGPTVRAEHAEAFSRSWMARSLPRSMRRQIQEAIIIQQQQDNADNDSVVIELPTRMTMPPSQRHIHPATMAVDGPFSREREEITRMSNAAATISIATPAPGAAPSEVTNDGREREADALENTAFAGGVSSNSAWPEERSRWKKWKLHKLSFSSR